MKKQVATLISIVTALTTCVSGAVLTGPIINSANNHLYYLLDQNSWTASESEANTLGGHLVTINDLPENQWVFSTFSPLLPQHSHLWIGINDVANTGIWTWASGESTTFTFWSPGEPNYIGSEHYGLMYGSDVSGLPSGLPGYWNNAYDGISSIYGVVEVVPEPSVLGISIAIGAGLCLVRRARCQRAPTIGLDWMPR